MKIPGLGCCCGVIAGIVSVILALIPIVGILLWGLTSIVGIYVIAGIVIAILDYCKVLK